MTFATSRSAVWICIETGRVAGWRGAAHQLNHVLLNKYIRKFLQSEKLMSGTAFL